MRLKVPEPSRERPKSPCNGRVGADPNGGLRLHIPAILLNPTNKTVKQVEAHNAQQREKVAAKKERGVARGDLPGGGKGKRVIRRKDNGELLFHPREIWRPDLVQAGLIILDRRVRMMGRR